MKTERACRLATGRKCTSRIDRWVWFPIAAAVLGEAEEVVHATEFCPKSTGRHMIVPMYQ